MRYLQFEMADGGQFHLAEGGQFTWVSQYSSIFIKSIIPNFFILWQSNVFAGFTELNIVENLQLFHNPTVPLFVATELLK